MRDADLLHQGPDGCCGLAPAYSPRGGRNLPQAQDTSLTTTLEGGTVAAGKAQLLQETLQMGNSSSDAGGQYSQQQQLGELPPAGAESEEPKPGSRTSQQHISPIHKAFSWGEGGYTKTQEQSMAIRKRRF